MPTQGITTTQGQVAITESVTGNYTAAAMFLSLVEGAFTPSFSHRAPSDIGPQPTVPGYSELDIDPADWSFNAGIGAATATLSDQTFTFGSYTTSLQTVTGWQLWETDDSVLWFEGLLTTPYTIPAGGGVLVLDALQLAFEPCGTSPPPPPPPVLLDYFYGVNGTSLLAHTPNIGPGWSALQNTLQIVGNDAVPVGSLLANNEDSVVMDAGIHDFKARCTLCPVQSGGAEVIPSLLVRVSNLSNYWRIDAELSSGAVRLIKKIGGVISVAQSSVQSLATGGVYELLASCSADSITVTFQDQVLFTHVDAFNELATQCGLMLGVGGAGGIAGASWSHFEVLVP